MTRPIAHCPARQQRGVALFAVMVFVLLSMLLALWASRSSLFNELVVGNDADYQRAYEAAQALLTDAERDIRRLRADNLPCQQVADGCLRRKPGVTNFPDGPENLLTLGSIPDCRHGLCRLDAGAPLNFWSKSDHFQKMIGPGVAATYGQYTGAVGGPDKHSNFILENRGWYWIEVAEANGRNACSEGLLVGGARGCLEIAPFPAFVYRITAVTQGRKEGTMVVLQQTYYSQGDGRDDQGNL